MVWNSDFNSRSVNNRLDGGWHRHGYGTFSCHSSREVGDVRLVGSGAVDHARIGWGCLDDLCLHGLDGRGPWCLLVLLVFLSISTDHQKSFGIGKKVVGSTVKEVRVPSLLRYSKDHEWVLIEGSRARVGITDYAQEALGDIVFIKLPEVGTSLRLHQDLGEIESTKSVNDIYAPVAGTVIAVNESLETSPDLLNSDPYGLGWICDIEMTEVNDSNLMSSQEYSALIGA